MSSAHILIETETYPASHFTPVETWQMFLLKLRRASCLLFQMLFLSVKHMVLCFVAHSDETVWNIKPFFAVNFVSCHFCVCPLSFRVLSDLVVFLGPTTRKPDKIFTGIFDGNWEQSFAELSSTPEKIRIEFPPFIDLNQFQSCRQMQ